MKSKIIEHYNRWSVVYGIAGLVIVIAYVTFAGDAVRKCIVNAWEMTPKHSFGWAAAIALGTVFVFSVMAAARMLYIVCYGKGVVAKIKWKIAAAKTKVKNRPHPWFLGIKRKARCETGQFKKFASAIVARKGKKVK